MEVYTTYKDRVFRLLFRDKKRLLELYNALNETYYDDVEALQVTTLENALYIKMKNDVSFIIDSNMCLYEHQSTYCPNMPLRGFLYFADLYKKYIKDVELSTPKLIRIPTPRYVVFYNGLEIEAEEFEQKLSEAFEDNRDGCIELTVRKTMVLEVAVESAVNDCIKKDILRDFLLEQKAEVIAMSIYEYNEEYARKAFFEEGVESGYAQGIDIGNAEMLIRSVESLMKKCAWDVQTACEGIGVLVEEYQKARSILEAVNKGTNEMEVRESLKG